MEPGNEGIDLKVLIALTDTPASRRGKILDVVGYLEKELKETNELCLFSGSPIVIYRGVEYKRTSDKTYMMQRFPDEELYMPVREFVYNRSVK